MSDEDIRVKTGLYRHFKGSLYWVLGVVRHTETDERLVVYRLDGSNDQFWARPVSMFLSAVEVEGRQVLRFTPVEDKLPESLPYRVVMTSDIFGREVYARDTWEEAVATMARLICKVNGEGDGIERVIGIEMNHANDDLDLDEDCDHNEMVENPDPAYVWRCGQCGYVYGKTEDDNE